MKTLGRSFMILCIMAVVCFARDPHAYVINSLGETLSKINLVSGQVTNNILTLGSDVQSYPNHIIVRDTMAYVINSGTDEIQIINLNSASTRGYINTGAGSNPYYMAFFDSQYVYVTLLMNNSVALVDIPGKSVVDEITVGKRPQGIVIHDYKAYIACTGYNPDWTLDPVGKVAVLDIPSRTIIKEIAVGTNPQYVEVDILGRVHVVCAGDYYSVFGKIFIIDAENDEVVDSLATGGIPGMITIGPDNIAYMPAAGFGYEPYIFSYHALTLEIYHDENNPLQIGGNCLMAIPYQDSTIYAGNWASDLVEVIDSGGTPLKSFILGDGPLHLGFDYMPGDVNGDYMLDISDITRIIAYLYLQGPKPRWPSWRANMNGDFYIDIADITFLINYLYINRNPAPKVGPTWLLPE